MGIRKMQKSGKKLSPVNSWHFYIKNREFTIKRDLHMYIFCDVHYHRENWEKRVKIFLKSNSFGSRIGTFLIWTKCGKISYEILT